MLCYYLSVLPGNRLDHKENGYISLGVKSGIRCIFTKSLGKLDFADDTSLRAYSNRLIKMKKRETGQNCSKSWTSDKKGKSKQLPNSRPSQTIIHISGGRGKVTKDRPQRLKSRHGSRRQREQFATLKNIELEDEKISKKTNIHYTAKKQTYTIFKSKSTSILQCAAESWQVTKRNVLYAIEVFQNKCRRILHIFWPNKLPNVELHARTGMLHPMDS